jgi:hypothetical protein
MRKDYAKPNGFQDQKRYRYERQLAKLWIEQHRPDIWKLITEAAGNKYRRRLVRQAVTLDEIKPFEEKV